MAIDIITAFNLSANEPLDARTRVADDTARLAITWPSRGLMVFQEADSGDGVDQTYQYIGDETTNLVGDWVLYTGVGATGPAGADGADGAAGAIGDTYAATSDTSVNIPTSHPTDVALTLDSDTYSYTPGQSVVAAEDATNYFEGVVKTYAASVLTITSSANTGTGSSPPTTAWTVNLDGATGIQGDVGIALIHTESDITFTDTATIGTIDDVEGGSWTTQAPWSASVFVDARGSFAAPTGVTGDMTGHSISYDGTDWHDNGIWRGPTGVPGPTGPVGNTGPQGIQGDTGSIGATGLTGPTGSQGPIGDPGVQGDPGAVGPEGPLGPQGPQGAQGYSTLSGIIPPTTQGVNGDTYVDTVTGLTYIKSEGTWTPDGGDLTGPQGVQGDNSVYYEDSYSASVSNTIVTFSTPKPDDRVVHKLNITTSNGYDVTLNLPSLGGIAARTLYRIEVQMFMSSGSNVIFDSAGATDRFVGSFLPSELGTPNPSSFNASRYCVTGAVNTKIGYFVFEFDWVSDCWKVIGGVSKPDLVAYVADDGTANISESDGQTWSIVKNTGGAYVRYEIRRNGTLVTGLDTVFVTTVEYGIGSFSNALNAVMIYNPADTVGGFYGRSQAFYVQVYLNNV